MDIKILGYFDIASPAVALAKEGDIRIFRYQVLGIRNCFAPCSPNKKRGY